MTISEKSWVRYIESLRKINDEAASHMLDFMDRNRDPDGLWNNRETRQAILDYAYSLVTKYGEGAASLACEMYDSVGAMSEIAIPAAVPAETPEFGEIAKAVNGALKHTQNEKVAAAAVGRQVKMMGVDTTMQNALRDGAEWAWVPHGDTCAFCLTLASRGWQKASRKALKNGHAEHIHANCDCTYAIRFDGKSSVEGYNPDTLLKQYDAAKGKTPAEKINSWRREIEKGKNSKTSADVSYSVADVTSEYHNKATQGEGHLREMPGFKEKQNERKVASSVFEKIGGDIKLLAEDNPDGERNPDMLWNGRLWDIKTTSTEKAANSAVKTGLKQIQKNPGGVILYYADRNINMTELRKIVDRRIEYSRPEKVDILILTDNDYTVWRYKK